MNKLIKQISITVKQSIECLNFFFHPKIQPESDGLTANMEENEVEQKEAQPKEDLKLGRLQYKIDYDFNTNNVRVSFQDHLLIRTKF